MSSATREWDGTPAKAAHVPMIEVGRRARLDRADALRGCSLRSVPVRDFRPNSFASSRSRFSAVDLDLLLRLAQIEVPRLRRLLFKEPIPIIKCGIRDIVRLVRAGFRTVQFSGSNGCRPDYEDLTRRLCAGNGRVLDGICSIDRACQASISREPTG